MAPLRIAVLCGGSSEERQVSLASAAMVVPALRRVGHHVEVLDTGFGLLPESEERDRLALAMTVALPGERTSYPVAAGPCEDQLVRDTVRDFDLVFLALHGGTGEDGTIQARLEAMGVPYTGSGHASSAVCMDKDLSKHILRSAGIATPDWRLIRRNEACSTHDFDYPVVVKPNKQGSTVGLSVVREAAQLTSAIEMAFRFDDEVLLEDFVPGREFTVGVLDKQPLTVGEILIDEDDAFGYEEKYTPGAVSEQFPAYIPADLERSIRETALCAHHLLKLRDYSRADFRLDTDGRLWCLELNSLPGLTPTSLLPQSARASGISFEQLCERICRLAMERSRRRIGRS